MHVSKNLLETTFNAKTKHLLNEMMLIEQQSSLGQCHQHTRTVSADRVGSSVDGKQRALWAQCYQQDFSNMEIPDLKTIYKFMVKIQGGIQVSQC